MKAKPDRDDSTEDEIAGTEPLEYAACAPHPALVERGQDRRPASPTDATGRHVEYYVYVLICLDRHGCRTYVGWTLDPERRLAEHNAGRGARSTRGRVWSVLHVEKFGSRREAMRREWYLKRDRTFRKQLADRWLAAQRTA